MPVYVGVNSQHPVMATANILQESSGKLSEDKVTITVELTGVDARILGDFVAAAEIVSLSFAGVPVERNSIKEKY